MLQDKFAVRISLKKGTFAGTLRVIKSTFYAKEQYRVCKWGKKREKYTEAFKQRLVHFYRALPFLDLVTTLFFI